MYADLIDGLDSENRAKVDAMLEGTTDEVDKKAKARRERAAVEAALRSAH